MSPARSARHQQCDVLWPPTPRSQRLAAGCPGLARTTALECGHGPSRYGLAQTAGEGRLPHERHARSSHRTRTYAVALLGYELCWICSLQTPQRDPHAAPRGQQAISGTRCVGDGLSSVAGCGVGAPARSRAGVTAVHEYIGRLDDHLFDTSPPCVCTAHVGLSLSVSPGRGALGSGVSGTNPEGTVVIEV